MPMKKYKTYSWFPILVFAILIQACGSSLNGTPTSLPVKPLASSTLPPTDLQNFKLTLESTRSVEPSSTPLSVTITAVNGNLSIRKGPDSVFDAIAILQDGDTLPVLGRSILDGWVEVPLPNQAGKTGWVSIKTSYSVVSGNVLDLPKSMRVEWPTGAYLRNCTNHQMVVQPGDKLLPTMSASPDNRIWFPPGQYAVYDQEVDGHPNVLHVQLMPRYEVDIKTDGSGVKTYCP